MQLDFHSEKPIFVQIAESLTDAVFVGAFPEETQVPSTTEVSAQYKINPATVLKGMNLLVEQDILYKKRGVGMFVQEGAVERIREKRRDAFYEVYIASMLEEAKKLGITREDLHAFIDKGGFDA